MAAAKPALCLGPRRLGPPAGRSTATWPAPAAGLAYRAFEDPDAPAATLQTAYDGFAANASAFAAFLRASLPEPWQGKAT